jgi:chaperonin GroES
MQGVGPFRPVFNRFQVRPLEEVMKRTKCPLFPIGDKVVIHRDEPDERVSGIILPDSAKEKPARGTVLAVGPGKPTEEGYRLTMDVKAGDRVLFSKYAGNEVEYDGEEYVIVSVDSIAAVIPDEE